MHLRRFVFVLNLKHCLLEQMRGEELVNIVHIGDRLVNGGVQPTKGLYHRIQHLAQHILDCLEKAYFGDSREKFKISIFYL